MLGGIGKFDLNNCFCVHFLLSIEDGNHDVPEYLALFVHNMCHMVHKTSALSLTVLLSVATFSLERADSALYLSG